MYTRFGPFQVTVTQYKWYLEIFSKNKKAEFVHFSQDLGVSRPKFKVIWENIGV